jgi:hypothetical protein
VTVLPQHVVVGETLVHHGVSLAFGHRFPLVLFYVSKADVFHDFLPFMVNWLFAPYSRLTEPKFDNNLVKCEKN